MKLLNKFSKEYFLKYRETPVKLKDYNPRQKQIADYYVDKLEKILNGVKVKIVIRGSTLFKIYGKGEVEIGVYTDEENWNVVLDKLRAEFNSPEVVEINYARFNSQYSEEEKEVEIIVLKNYEAEVDIKLHEYLLTKPKLLQEYVKIKKKSCHSKREYQIQKDNFLNRVIAQIPED